MKRILDIGHTDLRLFFKHKSAYIWLFVVPLAFVYFMSFAARGPGRPYNRTPPVLIENADTNFLGHIFLDELSAQNMRVLDPTNRETAARIIRIPANFTENALQLKPTKLQFLKGDDSGEADTALIEVRLVRALIAMNGHLLEAATQTNSGGGFTEKILVAKWDAGKFDQTAGISTPGIQHLATLLNNPESLYCLPPRKQANNPHA